MNRLNTIVSICLLFVTGISQAHTQMHQTSPVDGATLAQAPEKLELTFKAPVRLMKVELWQNGSEVIDFGFQRSMDPAVQLSWPLPELESGQYQIQWITMGEDGHKMKANSSFQIGLPSE